VSLPVIPFKIDSNPINPFPGSIIAIIINIFILSLLGSVRDARKSHYGQLIIYYLLSLIVGYSLLVYLALKNPMKLSHSACRNIGVLK